MLFVELFSHDSAWALVANSMFQLLLITIWLTGWLTRWWHVHRCSTFFSPPKLKTHMALSQTGCRSTFFSKHQHPPYILPPFNPPTPRKGVLRGISLPPRGPYLLRPHAAASAQQRRRRQHGEGPGDTAVRGGGWKDLGRFLAVSGTPRTCAGRDEEGAKMRQVGEPGFEEMARVWRDWRWNMKELMQESSVFIELFCWTAHGCSIDREPKKSPARCWTTRLGHKCVPSSMLTCWNLRRFGKFRGVGHKHLGCKSNKNRDFMGCIANNMGVSKPQYGCVWRTEDTSWNEAIPNWKLCEHHDWTADWGLKRMQFLTIKINGWCSSLRLSQWRHIPSFLTIQVQLDAFTLGSVALVSSISVSEVYQG